MGLQLLGLTDQQIRTAQSERQRQAGREILGRLTTARDGNATG